MASLPRGGEVLLVNICLHRQSWASSSQRLPWLIAGPLLRDSQPNAQQDVPGEAEGTVWWPQGAAYGGGLALLPHHLYGSSP
jgi:hypothetical protein